MGGYIGSRAVNLSTTAADVSGNATIGGNLTVSGTTVTIDSANAQTVDLGDNDKIRLGDGDDLQIYHDGSHSIIQDSGTGNLRIQANNLELNNADSSENYLFIDSSGNVGIGLSSGLSGLNVDGAVRSQNSSSNISYVGFTSYTGSSAAGTMFSYMGGDGRNTGYLNFSTNDTERMRIDSDGDLNIVNTGQASLNYTTDGSTDYAKITGGKSGSGVGDLRFFTYSGGIAERMRIDSAGRVGIGTNSPNSWGNGQNQLVVGDGTGDNGITIYSQNNANSNLRFSDGTSGSEQYRGRVEYDHVNDKLYLGAGGITPFVIDSSGNVGSGAVPETWSLGKALHIGNPENCFWAEGDYAFHMVQNGYYNSGWKYTHTDEASIYTQGDGKHIWFTAASGSADSTLTWSERMRIDNSGNVGIGTSSPKLNANGGTFLTVQGTGANGWLELATTSQTDNLGGAITFNNTNVSGTDKRVAQISSLRNGADNKAHLSFATNDGSGQVTRMRISSGGIVTKPYQPAFKASINSTTNRTGVENSVLKTPYDTTQLNVGNHFSTSNNRFTAPVAGNYFFSISQNHIGRHIIYLYKNGAVFHSGEFLHDTGGIWEHSTISAVIPLSANDYVEAYVKILSSTSTAHAWNGGSAYWDSFSGFLIG